MTKIIPAIGALTSGVLVTLSLAPFNYWPLALISTAILFTLLQQRDKSRPIKQAALLGWLFGLGLFGSGASWVYVSIHEFGYTSIPLAAFLTFLFCGGLAICCAITWGVYAWLNTSSHKQEQKQKPNRAQNLWTILLFAAIWVWGEWMRSWLLTGFPWLFIGYSQTETVLASWASIFGVYGISFIICFSGAALSTLITARKKLSTAAAPITLAITLWLIAIPLSTSPTEQTNSKPLKVSMVQANISQHEKWQRENLQPTMDLYTALSEQHWNDSELIIWPEAAIPTYYQYANEFIEVIQARALQTNSALLTGIPSRDTHSDSSYNSVITVGNASGVYHKQNLVPFGEYIPFAAIAANILDFFALPVSSMTAGHPDQAALSIQGWQSKPLICYEIVYPGLAAKAAAISDVLITISNDSWFGASIGPLQHLQMAQMRALENQRYVLRSTGNGVSAVIGPDGKILAKTPQFERTVLSAEFYLLNNITPWTRAGYWLTPLFLSAILLFALLKKFRHSKRAK